jgi:hypothetical protein
MNKNLEMMWNILSDCASHGKTITYGQLYTKITGEKWNFRKATNMYPMLGEVGKKCNELQIPCLNSLAVNKQGDWGEGIGKKGDKWHPQVPPIMEVSNIFLYKGIWKFIPNPFKQPSLLKVNV